jgi:excisionase family DNA binding protein
MATQGDPPQHDSSGDAGSYFTVAEAARKLKVSHSTVWRWIEAGRLPAYRVGPKNIRIAERDLDSVIAPATQSRLTEDEVARRLVALERAAALRRAQLAERGGVPLTSSTDLIRQIREELSHRV